MEIAKLGEFGVIEHRTKELKTKNASTVKGVGDDCAVLRYPDTETLVTTDMLMEGVHFDLTYMDMKHLGYKAAMVNISDIFAMGIGHCRRRYHLVIDRTCHQHNLHRRGEKRGYHIPERG